MRSKPPVPSPARHCMSRLGTAVMGGIPQAGAQGRSRLAGGSAGMLAGTPQPSLAARPHARECTKEPAGQTALSQHVLFAAGIPGQRVCSRAPGLPALSGCGTSRPEGGGTLWLEPQREAAAQGAPGLPLSPEGRSRGAAGAGVPPPAPHSAW